MTYSIPGRVMRARQLLTGQWLFELDAADNQHPPRVRVYYDEAYRFFGGELVQVYCDEPPVTGTLMRYATATRVDELDLDGNVKEVA